MMVYLLFSLCVLLDYGFATTLDDDIFSQTIIVNATEAFIFRFSPSTFKFNQSEAKLGIRYYLRFNGGEDLPYWFSMWNDEDTQNFYVFGSAPVDVTDFTITVDAMSKYTFRSQSITLTVNVFPRNDYAVHVVQILIRNTTISEFYNEDRMKDFMGIYKNEFWKTGKDQIYLTYIETGSNIPGHRYPLLPSEKEGVMIHVGCSCNYSNKIWDMEREIRPSTKNICPKYVKRMTFERVVRAKNFIFDWCYFKLLNMADFLSNLKKLKSDDDVFEDENQVFMGLDNTELILPYKEKIAAS